MWLNIEQDSFWQHLTLQASLILYIDLMELQPFEAGVYLNFVYLDTKQLNGYCGEQQDILTEKTHRIAPLSPSLSPSLLSIGKPSS